MDQPPIAHGGKVRVVSAAAAVVGLVVAAALGYDIVHRVSSPQWQVAGSTIETASVQTNASVKPLELSVYDHPRPVADIHFQDKQGHDLTLADFRGRVVLLNVWATWCVPCRHEMPTLDRLQARLGGKDFRVLALSLDRKGVEPVRAFYQEVGVEKLAIYVDPSNKASHTLAIPGVPITLLIDRKGREVARKMGAAEWDAPEMVSLIERTVHAQSTSNGGEHR